MKRFLLNLVMIPLVALLGLSTFQSCAFTGHPMTDLQTFWNSPALQAELATIQAQATTFINAWITSHLGARASTSNTALLNATVADLRAKHPNVPDVVLRGAAEKALAGGG